MNCLGHVVVFYRIPCPTLPKRTSGGSNEIGLETVEIDPQFAGSLGFAEGNIVCESSFIRTIDSDYWGADYISLPLCGMKG